MIFLASQSPRRRELLTQVDIHFDTISVDVDETPNPGESAAALVERLAAAKAAAGFAVVRDTADAQVIGADTIVVLDGEPLGKPVDRADAARMLQRLSGREHIVMSGVAVASVSGMRSARSDTRVMFATLDAASIERYVATGESDDKAGAYGIQGRAGAFVTRIEGSYSGVVGLPLHVLGELLSLPLFGP